jgi:hypothetical protein
MSKSEEIPNMNYYSTQLAAPHPTCSCVQDAVDFLQLLQSSDPKVRASSLSQAKERARQYAAVPACPWFSVDCYEKYAYLIQQIAEVYLRVIQEEQRQNILQIGDFVLSCSLSQEDRRQTLVPELEEFNNVVIQQFLVFTEGKGDDVTMTRHCLFEARRVVEECLQPIR